MLRSLRARLVLLTVAVTLSALVAASLLSRVAVRREFLQLETTDRRQGLTRAAALIEDRVRQGAAPGDSLLARATELSGLALILADDSGRVLAASAPELREARIRALGGNTVELTVRTRRGRALVLERVRYSGAPGPAVHAADGRPLGRLYPLAPAGAAEPERRLGFLPAVNRWLLFAAIGAGALAALLAATLSRRILGPVEALTRAAREMAAGNLDRRVEIRSRDEIGELARAFNGMAESLARNEALRRGLVADVAHELRTPLTRLRGHIEAIQDGLIAPDPAALESVHGEILLLARLVDDLQELALAEAGQLPLHRSPLAVAPAVAAALAAVSARARERGIALASEIPDGVRDVHADAGRLAQILGNLLANALTHARGRITVSAADRADGVALSITDDGEGIAPEHLSHVFDRFYRADPSRSRASGGTGLGLAIVRQLVEAHGGTVAVESQPGRGACFTFVLPAAGPS